MTRPRLRRQGALLLAGLVGLGAGALTTRALASDPDGEDRAGIERIVHDYILAHPEIIPEAMGRLQARESASTIGTVRGALEAPFAGAWAGSAHPKATLVMFTDYSCGYCRASVPDVDRLLAEVPDLRVVWREIPVLGPQSDGAARAALAAAKAGRYLPFHRALFAGRPDAKGLAAAAKAGGLDPARLVADAKGADVDAEIRANLALAGKLGVSGTPAFVVGDQMLSGAVGYEALRKAVDKARGA